MSPMVVDTIMAEIPRSSNVINSMSWRMTAPMMTPAKIIFVKSRNSLLMILNMAQNIFYTAKIQKIMKLDIWNY